MKIAIGSDMKNTVTDSVVEHLKELGHEVDLFGALQTEKALWSKVGVEVGEAIRDGRYDQGVLFCWTGTGISIAANKVNGIRAALCTDAETARGARKWNDANVLAMSLRLLSEPVAREIIAAWLEASPSTEEEDIAGWKYLQERAQD